MKALLLSILLAQLPNVGIDQRLNETVPVDATFRDESGQTVRLGDYFGKQPVVLVLVYYECPMLCTLVLNGLVSSLKSVNFNAGEHYQVVAVSIDPTETPSLAAAKKKEYLKELGRPGSEQGWHFLTGEESQIRRVTEAAGFRYTYDPQTKQYAHGSAVMVLTPEGRLARYLYGVEYPPRDLRLALVEASQRRIGTPVDAVMLLCFHYDPQSGKYNLFITRLLQVAGGLTALALGTGIWLMLRRARPVGRKQ